MTPLGIGPRDVLSLARHAQQAEAAAAHPVLVTGILAPQLADALAAGGDRSLVRTSGDPAEAGAFVRVVAGATTPEDEAQLRAATRALVPGGRRADGDCRPCGCRTCLATDIVEVPPGQRLPRRGDRGRTSPARSAASGRRSPRGCPCCASAFERHRKLDAVATAATLAALRPRQGAAPSRCWRCRRRGCCSTSRPPAARRHPSTRAPRREVVGPRLGARCRDRRSSRAALVRRLPVAEPPRSRRPSRPGRRSRSRRSSRGSGPSGPGPEDRVRHRPQRWRSRVPDTELAEELLQIEEADAWFEYLESTRGQNESRYQELEPWAWARLSQRLRAVRARRARLRPAAA